MPQMPRSRRKLVREFPGSTPEVARGESFVGEAEFARGKLQRKELNRPHFSVSSSGATSCAA
jgi:hypothetical protein